MKKPEDSKQTPWWQPGLILFTRLSGWIAGPVVIALFLGKYLDRRFGTEPWLFLLCVGVAFVLSSIGITYSAMKEMKKIDKEGKENQKAKSKNQNDNPKSKN